MNPRAIAPTLAFAARRALDWVLPRRCPGCGIVQPSDGFCLACWQSLEPIAPPWCATCMRPLGEDALALGSDARCAPCLAEPPEHDGIHAPFAYGEVVRGVAMRLKYGGRIGLARTMAGAMQRVLPDDGGAALLLPVPLHWTRLARRGFNQAALIAAELARLTGQRHDPLLLRRRRRTPPLKGMNPRQRAATVRGVFAIDPKRTSALDGATVWLVDDVYTSGATTAACVRLLKRRGAARVRIIAFARVLRTGEAGAPPPF